MESSVLRPLEPISFLFFLKHFKTAYDSDVIHEVAAMWFFCYFIKGSAMDDSSHHIKATENNDANKKGKSITTVKLSGSSLRLTGSMMSPPKPKLTSWRTSSQNMSAARCSENFEKKHLDEKESMMRQDSGMCQKTDFTSTSTLLWEITESPTKVPHCKRWHTMLPPCRNYKKALVVAEYPIKLTKKAGNYSS